MADEQYVYQGGVTVVSTPIEQVDTVYQGGVTVVSTPIENIDTVYQGGVTVVSCPILLCATGITLSIDGNDIDLDWTNASGNAGILIEHSTDGISYSTLIELDAGEITYTHVGPDKDEIHYYIFTAIDGLCSSSASAATSIVFGKVYAIGVAME